VGIVYAVNIEEQGVGNEREKPSALRMSYLFTNGRSRSRPVPPLIEKTLAQIELRRRYGVSVVAIRRDSQILSNPGADTLLHSNDVLFVLGSSEKISEAINTFSSSNKRN
jgi:K+/H+ antiporter YhaU regulatory subunit KhtT